MTEHTDLSPERADLLDSLRKHRHLFTLPLVGASDEQARTRSTVSELTLGGVVKHVTATAAEWLDFTERGAGAMPEVDWDNVDWCDPPPEVLARMAEFTMGEGETLAGLQARFDEVFDRAERLAVEADLDVSHELPPAPWFPPGTAWSTRRVLMHLVAETSQHAGHADIIREAIDGQKSMG